MKNKITNGLYYIVLAIILLFGFYIRTKLFIASDIFEDDECRLALGMMDKSLWQMFLPLGAFSSTPLFSFVSKIIGDLSNYNEHALKFLPYIFSILSLGLFYKICEEFFNRKISVILSVFLLVVNYDAIYFSSIFKTYSIEVFVSLLCLYYFPKIKIIELNTKQLIFLSLGIIFLMLLSLPSLFFIAAYFILSLIYNYKDKLFYKKFFIILMPFLLTFALYYFYYLLPAKVMQLETFSEFWNVVFSAKVSISNVVFIKSLLKPNKYTLCAFILIICYTVHVIFSKEEQKPSNIYLLSVFYISILASVFKFYPLIIGRTAVYLLPLLLIIMLKILDDTDIKRISFYLLSVVCALGLCAYFTPSYYSNINNLTTYFRNYSPDILMQDMIAKFNPERDEIITTQASAYSYTFYAIKHKFYKKWYMYDNEYNKDFKRNPDKKFSDFDTALKEYSKYYNKLDKNKNYWFYLIKEFPLTPQLEPTREWLKYQNILYSKQERGSYLYYISGIREVNP